MCCQSALTALGIVYILLQNFFSHLFFISSEDFIYTLKYNPFISPIRIKCVYADMYKQNYSKQNLTIIIEDQC